ncbi:MAG: hypothetical protein FWC25_01240 [Dehalococcoidia bacterium]|nr:hypothetical protein [Dehalococcoidia bacterium]
MKRLLFAAIATIVLLSISVTSCSSNPSIVGVWEDSKGDWYTFYGDGKFLFSGIGAAEGTYSLHGSKITFDLVDFEIASIAADYSFRDNNTLVIENPISDSGETGGLTTLSRVKNAALPVFGKQFHAHVIQSHESYLHVKGISENDINHRGEFTLSFKNSSNNNAIFDANGNKINFTDIPEGSLVLIVYKGPVLEMWPGVIGDTISVRVQ